VGAIMVGIAKNAASIAVPIDGLDIESARACSSPASGQR
jgi:hypothetical protein